MAQNWDQWNIQGDYVCQGDLLSRIYLSYVVKVLHLISGMQKHAERYMDAKSVKQLNQFPTCCLRMIISYSSEQMHMKAQLSNICYISMS
jgi:hypothetical protein